MHQNEKNRAEPRFEELCRGQQASCIAEPASWTCKPLKRNFEEISTKTKTFRKKFQNNFKSSNPKSHLATDEVWRLAQGMGRSPCSSQTSTGKNVREVAHPRPRRPRPKFRRNLGYFCRFLRKIQNFSKKFSSFLHTFRTRLLNLSISKGRSPIRARVRTTPVFGKKADGSTAERRAGEDQTRAAGHGPATPPTPTFERATQTHSRDSGPMVH